MNPPRVVFDNESDQCSTLIKVDCANKEGCLLQVVQLLTDLDLVIHKAHVSSDGGWLVDVFYVTDQLGAKLTDPEVFAYIQQKLGAVKESTVTNVRTCTGRSTSELDINKLRHASIEMSGRDRPGLLYDIASTIASMGCSVLSAEVWTNNNNVALLIHVTEVSGAALLNENTLQAISGRLKELVQDTDFVRTSCAKVANDAHHPGRRMHQLMFSTRDYERSRATAEPKAETLLLKPVIAVRNSEESGYSIINVTCEDRPKLLFDSVCTLTDMQYVIYHATIDSCEGVATQEYFVRSIDGALIEDEAERERVAQCLEAAIQRHSPLGVCLELRTTDRVGLLADVTRVFKERGISISAAVVSTRNGRAVNEFFVVDKAGGLIDSRTLELVRKEVGPGALAMRSPPTSRPSSPPRTRHNTPFSLSSLLRSQSEWLMGSLGLSSLIDASAPQ